MTSVTKGGTEYDPAALERTERRFFGELFDAVPAAVAEAHGVRRAKFGPVQATITVAAPEVRTLNLLLGAETTDAAAEGFLGEAIEWARGEGADDFRRAVGGVIIADDQFGFPMGAGESSAGGLHVAQGFAEQAFFIEGRNDDGDFQLATEFNTKARR